MRCIDDVVSDVHNALKVVPNGTNSTIKCYYTSGFPFATDTSGRYTFFVAIDNKLRINTARYTIVDPNGLVYCFDDNDAVTSIYRCTTDDSIAREISRIVSLMLDRPPASRYYLGEILNCPSYIARSGILYLNTTIPHHLVASDSVIERHNASVMLLINQHAEALAAIALNSVMQMLIEARHEHVPQEIVDNLNLKLIAG